MHKCENMLLVCMDFRLAKTHTDWAEQNLGNQNYDLIALAGAQKAIVDEDTREAVLKQIDISVRLHGMKVVNIIAHEDCGAYGGTASLGDWSNETKTYLNDLNQAEEIIKQKFDVEVKKYILKLNGEIEQI